MNTKCYTLKHKDRSVAYFEIAKQDVVSAEIFKHNIDYLPLPLKRIIHNKSEFIEKETWEAFILNEEGCYLVENWLSNREIPQNRENYNAYIKKKTSARQWMLENNAYSFTDCYWIEKDFEPLTWDNIVTKLSGVDEYYSIKDSSNMYKGHNSTLGGTLEKFWYKSDGILKLCKKTSKLDDVLNAREVIASLIYKRQGFKKACDYDFVYDTEGDIVGCKCVAFTNENTEIVTAYDLLEEHNRTQSDDVYELIQEFASDYGLDKQIVSDYMDLQTLVDFLITNRDRHQENIAFLRDANTLKLIDVAPIYDSGSSRHLEGQHPETISNTTVNGLYPTELECLDHIKNIFILDLDKLPSKWEIKAILDKCKNITEVRKDKLLSLYEGKIGYLRQLQQNRKISEDYSIADDEARKDNPEWDGFPGLE